MSTDDLRSNDRDAIRAYWDDFAADYDTYPDHGLLAYRKVSEALAGSHT